MGAPRGKKRGGMSVRAVHNQRSEREATALGGRAYVGTGRCRETPSNKA